jgi:hypothetical protein
MKLIESKTLGTAQASIEFTSIPQTFTDLVVVVSARWNSGTGTAGIRFNASDTGYSWRWLNGDGSTASSLSASSNTGNIGDFPANTTTSNTFSSHSIYIPNYTASQNKSFSVDTVTENNATSNAFQQIVANLWSNTAAITSLSLLTYNNGGLNLAVGSTASLYGILKGSDGIVTTSP